MSDQIFQSMEIRRVTLLRVQAILLVIILAVIIPGTLANHTEEDDRILQFNSRFISGVDSPAGTARPSLGEPETASGSIFDQISSVIPLRQEISKDLTTIAQRSAIANDLFFKEEILNEDLWKQQLQAGFNYLIEPPMECWEVEEDMPDSYLLAGISEVDSNFLSLMYCDGDAADPWTSESSAALDYPLPAADPMPDASRLSVDRSP